MQSHTNANVNPELNSTTRGNAPTVEAPSGFNALDVLENIVDYWRVAVAVALVVLAGATLFALSSRPIYTADVLLRVGANKASSSISSLGAAGSSILGPEQASMITELELIRSRNVIGRALELMRANTEITIDNRFPIIGNWLATRLQKAPDGLVPPPLGLSGFAWGGEEFRFDSLELPESLIGRPLELVITAPGKWRLINASSDKELLSGELGLQAESEDGKISMVVNTLRGRPGTTFRLVQFDPVTRAKQFASRVDVAESKRGSSMIRLSVSDPSPWQAQRIANAVADAYVGQNIESRSEEAAKSLAFLKSRLPELKRQAEQAESELITFRKKERLLDISSEVKMSMDKLVALETARLQAQDKRAELSAIYQPKHPAMQALDQQIEKLKAQEAAYATNFRNLPAAMQQQIQLTRDVEVANQMYTSMLSNAQQIQIAKEGTVGSVAIIDRAILPQSPTWPPRPKIVAIGGLIGIVLGLLAAQGVAVFAGRVRDPKKVERATNLATYAIIPSAPEQHEIDEQRKDGAEAALLSQLHPSSPSVEALRSLRIALQFALSETSRKKVILITSAVAGQGKSFISSNLAYLLASSGRRTLVIDADVRKSTLSRYLKVSSEVGLTEVLKGRQNVGSLIIPSGVDNLFILPAGKQLKNPGEAFAGTDIGSLIETVAADFDVVVIDSPPVLAVTDATILSKFVDLTAFVVRQGSVAYGEIEDALKVIKRAGGRATGIIFNGYAPSSVRYGYGYGRRYAYYRYGYGQGQKSKIASQVARLLPRRKDSGY